MTEIAGWLGEDLKIRVSQPPEKGKANRDVESLIRRALAIPPDSARIVRGATPASKVLEIDGLSLADIRGRLRANDT